MSPKSSAPRPCGAPCRKLSGDSGANAARHVPAAMDCQLLASLSAEDQAELCLARRFLAQF